MHHYATDVDGVAIAGRREPVLNGDALASGDHRLDVVAQAGQRGEERRQPRSILLGAHRAATEGAGVLVDELGGDVGGDRFGVSTGERREVRADDVLRAHLPQIARAVAYTP